MEKKLVYKSKHGDIPVIVRDYVPDGEVWFTNGEVPIDIFDDKTVQQKERGKAIKEKAQELLQLFMDSKWSNTNEVDKEKSRCIDQAIPRLEEAVMWACKGIYTTKEQL